MVSAEPGSSTVVAVTARYCRWVLTTTPGQAVTCGHYPLGQLVQTATPLGQLVPLTSSNVPRLHWEGHGGPVGLADDAL